MDLGDTKAKNRNAPQLFLQFHSHPAATPDLSQLATYQNNCCLGIQTHLCDLLPPSDCHLGTKGILLRKDLSNTLLLRTVHPEAQRKPPSHC
ncbi:hypothetical protein PtA15_10A257 [Puccinia triticina]|uniref:Uncharacterized protein n=1 Tax=Puccinia triticina TaxID=208348 RepID=A0ABY7CWK5_9BASI|nr:uncharacterized protein PtA15_10A257 [Puccinia triticina]WAQ88837.1 hypothetical protein PtA15_10A257 [Puccinia triticina]